MLSMIIVYNEIFSSVIVFWSSRIKFKKEEKQNMTNEKEEMKDQWHALDGHRRKEYDLELFVYISSSSSSASSSDA